MSEHDMQNTNPPLPPLPPEITQLLSGLDAAQWAWLSGYAWAKAGNGASAGLPALQTALPAAERNIGEGFGDFAIRTGIVKPVLNAPVDFWDASKAVAIARA